MHPRMIFKIGMSFIIIVAVVMYYIINSRRDHVSSDSKSEQAQASSKFYKDGVIMEERIKSLVHGADRDNSKMKMAEAAAEIQPSRGMNSKEESSKQHKTDAEGEKSLDLDEKSMAAAAAEKKEKAQVQPEKEALKAEFTSRLSGGDGSKSMHLSVVACGMDRFEETVVLLKSAVLFSKRHLIFHVFADDELRPKFKSELDFWPEKCQKKMQYNIYPLAFPASDAENWKKLFKPCASQRIFLPALLTDVDSLIYVDTDVLFLTPVDDVYKFFQDFNSSQLAAVAPEHEDKAVGWYNRFARHPYYGVLGVNSGVMLMNLTRLRATTWSKDMANFYKEYKLKIPWGDQDLINIYFHYHPDQLYVFPCEWNYRADHCMYMSVCKGAHDDGANILHGSRRVWHNNKMPAFAAVYKAFKEFQFGEDLQFGLLKSLKNNMAKPQVTKSNCGTVGHIFFKRLEQGVTSFK